MASDTEELRKQLLTLKDESGDYVISSLIDPTPSKLHALIDFILTHDQLIKEKLLASSVLDHYRDRDGVSCVVIPRTVIEQIYPNELSKVEEKS